jgi:hypothetical protein
MKTKNFLFLFCGLMILGLSSCKKTYTCSCKWAGGITSPAPVSVDFSDATKEEAYNACEEVESSHNNDPNFIIAEGPCSCELE